MPYIGRDGLTHQETIIDWDIKSKVSMSTITPEEVAQINQQLVDYRKSLINRILSTPAEMAGEQYFDFINRNRETMTISWHAEMVADPGMDMDKLRNMCTSVEARWELYQNNGLSLKTPQVKD